MVAARLRLSGCEQTTAKLHGLPVEARAAAMRLSLGCFEQQQARRWQG